MRPQNSSLLVVDANGSFWLLLVGSHAILVFGGRLTLAAHYFFRDLADVIK
jgi:hypothetical protein